MAVMPHYIRAVRNDVTKQQLQVVARNQEVPKATYPKQLANAIDMADDASIEELVRLSANPAKAVEEVRIAAPLQQMAIEVASVRAVVEESCLWLMPIVACSGASLVFQQILSTEASPVMLFKEWIAEWFCKRTKLGIMAMMPDYFAFAALPPGQIRQTLDAMNMPGRVALPTFHPGPLGSAIEAELPILGFIVGSATKFREAPSFNGRGPSSNIQLQERIRASMPYISGDYEPSACERYRVGTPMPMTAGLIQGLQLWISEVKNSFEIEQWDLAHAGFSDAVLSLTLKNLKSHRDAVVRMPMSLYQIGAEGVQSIANVLPSKKRSNTNDIQGGWGC